MPSAWKRITWCPMADDRRTITCEMLRGASASALEGDPDYPSGASPEGNDGAAGAEEIYRVAA